MEHGAVALIPIEDIHILNPRVRNQIIAEEIRQNIRSIGLKRPITVAPRKDAKNGKKYDLVCGQGRIEAFISAGVTEIPAIVREVSEVDAHLMSLVENIARRNSSALELLQSIKYLKSQGYADDAIAVKTNLGKDYIRGIIRLLEEGEEYLVNAVEKGRIPLYQALNIAAEDDTAVQTALTEAYESGALTGKKLVVLQKIISRRKHYVLVAESYIEKMQGLVKLSPELKADVITTACRVHMKETPNSTEVNPELIRYLLMLPR
jgi:ParB family chromosome partitioning protein